MRRSSFVHIMIVALRSAWTWKRRRLMQLGTAGTVLVLVVWWFAHSPTAVLPAAARVQRDVGAGEGALSRAAPPSAARTPRAALARFQSPQVRTLAVPHGDSISGHVLDATGGPVSGARVTARATEGDGEAAAVTESDVTGAFRLELAARHAELSAQVEAYSLATRWVEVPAQGVNLVLAPASRLCGRVVEHDTGRAIAGTVVHAQNNNGLRAEPRPVPTDAQGAFCFDALSAGVYALWVAGNGFRSERAWQAIGVGESLANVTLKALVAGSVDGLLRARGEPCVDGSVELIGSNQVRFLSRASSGRVAFEGLPPGTYTARVDCASALPLREELEVGIERTTRTWDLDAGFELRGSVRRSSGEALAAIGVLMTPTGSLTSSDLAAPLRAVSDEHGEFRAQGLLGGEYALSLDLRTEQAAAPTVVAVSERTPSVELVAAAEASIHAGLRLAGPRTLFVQRADMNFPLPAERRGDLFVFEHLPLGRYAVFTSAGAAFSPDGVSVELRTDGEVVSITLEATDQLSAISGRVEDEAGEPVPDAWVTATTAQPTPFAPSADSDPLLTNERGEFTLTGLAAGRYRVAVTSDQGEAVAADVATGANIVLRVPRFGVLSGSIRTSNGELVSDAQLTIQHESGRQNVISVADGSWALPWAAPGRYDLSVVSSQGHAAASGVMLEGGRERQVTLELDPG